MKKTIKIIAITMFAFLFLSCTSTNMYSWYNYQEDYYHYLKNSDDKSLEKLTKTYQKIIEKQTATRGTVPPGIYADYGWLLLQSGKTAEGKAMLAKEVELYPESQVFVASILKRFK